MHAASRSAEMNGSSMACRLPCCVDRRHRQQSRIDGEMQPMYSYWIVVPEDCADEVLNVLRDQAEVRQEGTMPTPEEMASDEAWAIQSGTPLAVMHVQGPTLQSVSSLKNWLELRFADPYIDIRAREPSGAYTFSFRAHSAEEIKDWVENQTSGKPLTRWARRGR